MTFRHFVPGHDIRMRGDGCDTDISLGLSRDTSLSSLAEASTCSMSSGMLDIVKVRYDNGICLDDRGDHVTKEKFECQMSFIKSNQNIALIYLPKSCFHF